MRPDLRVVQGGRAPRPVPSDNIIYLEDSRHGIEPPSLIEVCDRLAPRLPSGVGGLHGVALSVFLEMTGERWLQSRGEVGLRVSLASRPRVKGGRRRAVLQRARAHWTFEIRERSVHGGYELFLPVQARGARVVVPFAWCPAGEAPAVLHEITFSAGSGGWRPTAHTSRAVMAVGFASEVDVVEQTP